MDVLVEWLRLRKAIALRHQAVLPADPPAVEDIEASSVEFSMDPQLMDVLDILEEPPEPYAWLEVVRDILEEMGKRDRYLIESRFYERLSYRAMARRFGWKNHESARWALHKALERFKQGFEAAGYDIEQPPKGEENE